MEQCLFCRMVRKELHPQIVYEDEIVLAFEDIHPQAPIHVLVVPKKHLVSMNDLAPEDGPLAGHLLWVAAHIAEKKRIQQSGYRIVVNNNSEAGQSVFHLHLHVLGGRLMRWPPG